MEGRETLHTFLQLYYFFINCKYIYNNVRTYIIYSVALEEYDSPITEPKSVVLPITPQGKQQREGDSNPHGHNAQQIFKCFSALRLSLYHINYDLGSRYIVCTHLRIINSTQLGIIVIYRADTFPELACFYSKSFLLGTHYPFLISEVFGLAMTIRTKNL